jgi:bis(5'-adenosyl)-triphosphatase
MNELKLVDGKCPFCKETVTGSSFMHSDNFLAIYNIAPILRGHSLVIPKRHVISLFELSEAESTEFFMFSKEVTELLMEAFKGEGFDWSIQEGIVAGQSVLHLHLHIVIRKPNDMKEQVEWYHKVKENELAQLDSNSRPRLSDNEYLFYSDYLRNESELKKEKSNKK